MEVPQAVPGEAETKCTLCTDPLDGSANIDANGAVGMIFAVYRRREDSLRDSLQQVLPQGSEQGAAGYVMYGPSTLLAYTSCAGVNGFTLDPNLGEFLLSHAELRCRLEQPAFSVIANHNLLSVLAILRYSMCHVHQRTELRCGYFLRDAFAGLCPRRDCCAAAV